MQSHWQWGVVNSLLCQSGSWPAHMTMISILCLLSSMNTDYWWNVSECSSSTSTSSSSQWCRLQIAARNTRVWCWVVVVLGVGRPDLAGSINQLAITSNKQAEDISPAQPLTLLTRNSWVITIHHSFITNSTCLLYSGPPTSDRRTTISYLGPSTSDRHTSISYWGPSTSDRHILILYWGSSTSDRHILISYWGPSTSDRHILISYWGPPTSDRHTPLPYSTLQLCLVGAALISTIGVTPLKISSMEFSILALYPKSAGL